MRAVYVHCVVKRAPPSQFVVSPMSIIVTDVFMPQIFGNKLFGSQYMMNTYMMDSDGD